MLNKITQKNSNYIVLESSEDRQQIFDWVYKCSPLLVGLASDQISFSFRIQNPVRNQERNANELWNVELCMQSERSPNENEPMSFCFHLDEGQFFFRTNIQKNADLGWQINPNVDLYWVQRRDGHRKTIPKNLPFYFVLSKANQIDFSTIHPQFNMADFSLGGLNFQANERYPLKIDDQLDGELIYENTPPLPVKIKVRHVTDTLDRKPFIGASFENLDFVEQSKILSLSILIHREIFAKSSEEAAIEIASENS